MIEATDTKASTDPLPWLYRGVVQDGWKYVARTSGQKELYDLQADPFELQNVAGKAAYATRQQQLGAAADEVPVLRGRDLPLNCPASRRDLPVGPSLSQVIGVDEGVAMRRWVGRPMNWSIVLAQSMTRARTTLIRAGYPEDVATKLVTDAADRGMDPERFAAKLARKRH